MDVFSITWLRKGVSQKREMLSFDLVHQHDYGYVCWKLVSNFILMIDAFSDIILQASVV